MKKQYLAKHNASSIPDKGMFIASNDHRRREVVLDANLAFCSSACLQNLSKSKTVNHFTIFKATVYVAFCVLFYAFEASATTKSRNLRKGNKMAKNMRF